MEVMVKSARSIGLTLALSVAMAGLAQAAPKQAKVGQITHYIKGSCKVVGVGSQTCTLCEDAELTKNCKEYLCDTQNPPGCAAIRIKGPAHDDIVGAAGAIDYYTQAADAAAGAGDSLGESVALGELGLAYAAAGDPRRAAALYEQALGIQRELGLGSGDGSTLGNLAQAYADLGDPRRALALYEETLAVAQGSGCQRSIAYTLYNMSLALNRLGERAEAVAHAEAALSILERLEDPNALTVQRQLIFWR
jgi:tetratricopeptide (TPR) repeat protein